MREGENNGQVRIYNTITCPRCTWDVFTSSKRLQFFAGNVNEIEQWYGVVLSAASETVKIRWDVSNGLLDLRQAHFMGLGTKM